MDSQANSNVQRAHAAIGVDSSDMIINDNLQSQDSFGKWLNHVIADSPCSVDDSGLESSVSSIHDSYSPVMDHHQPSLPEQVFNITDVSPVWAYSSEETKVSFLLFLCS